MDIEAEQCNHTPEDSYQIQMKIDRKSYTVEILDISGAERFIAMRDLYIMNSQAFLLVFSIYNQDSFNEIADLVGQISRVKDKELYELPLFLVGTNCSADGGPISLGVNRIVAMDEAQRFAESLYATYMECDLYTSSSLTARQNILVPLIKAATQSRMVDVISQEEKPIARRGLAG